MTTSAQFKQAQKTYRLKRWALQDSGEDKGGLSISQIASEKLKLVPVKTYLENKLGKARHTQAMIQTLGLMLSVAHRISDGQVSMWLQADKASESLVKYSIKASGRTVRRYLEELEKAGLIIHVQGYVKNSTCTVYALSPEFLELLEARSKWVGLTAEQAQANVERYHNIQKDVLEGISSPEKLAPPSYKKFDYSDWRGGVATRMLKQPHKTAA